jgi:hypothetical protein
MQSIKNVITKYFIIKPNTQDKQEIGEMSNFANQRLSVGPYSTY